MSLNAVFQGGGVKGIALVGALARVEEDNVVFSSVAGTSAGSSVAALYAAGYKSEEMKGILEQTRFSDFAKVEPLGLSRITRMCSRWGLYETSALHDWISQHLRARNVRTFKDIKLTDLKIVASDISKRELVVFSKNTHPDMSVADAVVLSSSIPIFFVPGKLDGKVLVDGGMLSNFPVHLFPDWERTLGFQLLGDPAPPPTSLRGYFKSLLNTMLEAHDKRTIAGRPSANIIQIETCGIPATKFSLSQADSKILYGAGFQAASSFLSTHPNACVSGLRIAKRPEELLFVSLPDKELSSEEKIRISFSSLVRVVFKGRYLLVKGGRISDQFQPVGGVWKYYSRMESQFRRWGVEQDDRFQVDQRSKSDLRLFVPLGNLSSFVEWYQTGSGRETSPWREFREELLVSGILPEDAFHNIEYEHIRTVVRGVEWCERFGCYELRMAEIFDLCPTAAQEECFRQSQGQDGDGRFLWAEESLIRSGGYDSGLQRDAARVSDNASWLL
ncbi:MAG: patatin-like phospholipase family protein [Candidatus Eremiobacteraeota bacterium]|nr:patatin-like phospholipase family protein [Candidatus Eremiobacteraeota bacterium]